MARPQPLLPACPLPAPPTMAVAACSVDRSPPAPESMGQGRALPCARGLAPQCGQGPPRTDPALRGCPGPPLVLPLGRAGCAAGRGSWAVLVPVLPRLCLHPACAGQSPASLQPQPPERPCPPDVPCPHLVTIRSAPCRSPFPAPPALAAPSPWAGGWCREPLHRPLPHTGAVAWAPTHPVPAPVPACHGRSRRLGATGLFFYNNFLVHSNFFL